MAIVITGNGIDMGGNPVSNVTINNNVDVVDKEYVDTGAGAAFIANDARVKTALNAGGTAPIYACRAWVNFNGTGTVAIRASGNVSSITDNGIGDYTVNFTSELPDTNYVVAGSCRYSGSNHIVVIGEYETGVTRTTNYFKVVIGTTGSASVVGHRLDAPTVSIAFF